MNEIVVKINAATQEEAIEIIDFFKEKTKDLIDTSPVSLEITVSG